MAAEVLSQEEIDQLLNAINTGEVDANEINQTGDQRKIKIYDFKRPDKFSKDQIRTISMIHETFARLTTTGLSAQLRAMAHVHVASVDQLTYEEFIRSIPNPTTLAVIDMEPLKGNAVLEIDPSITFAIIDKLFGGKGESDTKLARELTEIESAVIEGVIVRVLGNLREAWSNVIDLRPRLGRIEVNPQFAQIVPPSDMVVLVTLETKIGEVEGMMNFCIPYITIEPVISKLSGQYWYSSVRKGTTSENLMVIKERLNTVWVTIIVEIGKIEIKVRDVLALRKGDFIKLDKVKVTDNFILKVEDKDKFECRPGVVGSKMAVQVVKVLKQPEAKEIEEIEEEVEE
jgi:flagellar motor switch protein FliM